MTTKALDEIGKEHTSEDIGNLLSATECDHNLLPGVITGNETLCVGEQISELASTSKFRLPNFKPNKNADRLPTGQDDFPRA